MKQTKQNIIRLDQEDQRLLEQLSVRLDRSKTSTVRVALRELATTVAARGAEQP